jgi:DNA helicase IV
VVSVKQLKEEQTYFDQAWEAREESRRTLAAASDAASGPRAAAAVVRRGAEAVLQKLGDPDEAVAFARFDDVHGERIYLGKHAITDTERELLVINWQAPAAAPYFQASYDEPCGVALRRKFSTERNKVLDFEEILFADLARAVGSMTESERSGIDDTVLRDLEQDRTGEMQDIVQTIHAAQYQLVRSPLDQLLVIQGGPGTGKTAVALHRVSWLLFNNLGRLSPDDVLVVGPNPTFTRYIRAVLPGLGDSDVQHRDLRTLGPQPSSKRAEAEEVARLKGDSRLAALLAKALRQRVRFPAGQDQIEVGAPGRTVFVSRADAEGQLRRLVQSATNYNAGRLGFRSWLTSYVGSSADPTQIDAAAERVWPSLTPQAFLRDLFGSRERLVAAAGDDFTAGDVGRLLRSAAQRVADEDWSDADVALLDEADSLINGIGVRYAHVVVDEAQDLSPMQLRSIRRRSKNGSLTVVGDLAQSTGPWARDSWEDVISGLKQDLPAVAEELILGYRVPEQVFALAAQLLPSAAPRVTPPRVIRTGPADPDLRHVSADDRIPQAVGAARDHAGRGHFVGIVCPATLRDELTDALRRAGVAWSDASRGNLSKSINVVSPEEAKGLEFDAVVVLEPEEIVKESAYGLRLLYVALTRTTRYLTVVHVGALIPLPEGAPLSRSPRRPAMVESHREPPEALVDISKELVADHGDTGQDSARAHREKLAESHSITSSGAATTMPNQSDDLARMVSETVAISLARSVRDSVAPALWPYVIDRLRRELNVSDVELFDLFGD